MKDSMKKLLYADDLTLVATINLENTELLHIGHHMEEMDIELEGKKLTQGDSFVYLGGAVCGDGKTEREVRRRAHAGANEWRAVGGVMADRRTGGSQTGERARS